MQQSKGLTTQVQYILFQEHWKSPEMPLARIKKIMKMDEEVKVISLIVYMHIVYVHYCSMIKVKALGFLLFLSISCNFPKIYTVCFLHR